jgi:electron transport complex protein RnfB
MIGLVLILTMLAGLMGTLVLYNHFLTQYKENIQIVYLADQIESLLPQTQCRQCHYDGCRPYAMAIAAGDARIDQCPPGGQQTVQAISGLLGRETRQNNYNKSLDTPSMVASIDEDLCIGCVKCIHACPVDAIIGAPKQMHSVINKYCTGCELCLPPCPVNCISMLPAQVKTHEWVWEKPKQVYRERS